MMKKWAISAVVYLFIVIVGYNVYVNWAGKEAVPAHEQGAAYNGDKVDTHEEEPHEQGGHGAAHDDQHGDHGGHGTAESEVIANIDVSNKEMNISLQDQQGNAVEELEVNHEKLLHLIVVDDHLETYVHLHPEQIGPGEFKINHSLPDGSYKAFIDIKPKSLSYAVTPISFAIGDQEKEHAHPQLTADAVFEQKVDDYKVTLNLSELKAGQDVTLTFDLHGKQPEPYLGAQGHVVILDESGEKYLHVHPANNKDTIFETSFDEPGLYKIWAEFKQDGAVRAFPFVVEVQ
ncbi:hypothetical protein [Priestia abyssalis]|uniref:hypothetical protein n=1 Tax=Priestia abyssalis TaxID=1221450 RepID=UPI001F48F3AE|nr:hypothetical protein [Priestia abyssalis]